MREKPYSRSPLGELFEFGGMAIEYPYDAMPTGKYPFGQNIRGYQRGRIGSRVPLDSASITIAGQPIHTIARLNDSTPDGPGIGYALIIGAGTDLYCNQVQVDTGYSGNPLSMVPFRPNESVQPWMYVGDSNKISKVRSDGLTYKAGIKEPQVAPVVGTAATTVTGTLTVPGTAIPWSPSLNPTYSFTIVGSGQTSPEVIAPPELVSGSTVKLSSSGTVHIGGGVTPHGPADSGSTASGFPGSFITGGGAATILIGAFTNSTGVIVAQVSPTDMDIVAAGGTVTLLVPTNATQLQLGIDDDVFTGNTGSFTVNWSVTESAVATVVSLLGPVTAYYWGTPPPAGGGSPHTGPVGLYIWSNPDDTGGGTPRSITDLLDGSSTNNSLIFDQTPSNSTEPVLWATLNDEGDVTGTIPVYQPALESEGYADFNMCIVFSLFFPAAGTYALTLLAKDNVMWGLGNNATWPDKGTILGAVNQTETVIDALPLLPAPSVNTEGAATSVTVNVTVPAAGVYSGEIDWDYWDKSGRTLVLTCNNAVIPPLPSTVKQDVQYEYVYRSSATGAQSNPSPPSVLQTVPVNANTVVATYSPDPQVDKIDFYRIDTSLDNYTYVLTTENTNPPTQVTDTLLDIDISGNQILQIDNYEPFPSIDLPNTGTVTVSGGVVTWASGDLFNLRWLPGSIINIGGYDYALTARPTSATTLLAGDVPSTSTPVIYEIDAAGLAAQPMASIWGPTPSGFAFGCGDTLRPGTFYWSKGNNLDAAPDTNQQDLTSPSEALINGCINNGQSVIFSAERGWTIFPTFTSAQATSTGDLGSTWNPVTMEISRGLFIRPALAVDGFGNIYFRAKDGICVTTGGPEQSITDDDLYGLFSHEGEPPLYPTLQIGNYTVYAPDDSLPENQKMVVTNGFLYYDYLDYQSNPRTLVYDTKRKAFCIDQYQFPVICHAIETGPTVNTALVGTSDGTVRQFKNTNSEHGICVILTPAQNGGDARGQKIMGDIFLKGTIQNGKSVTLSAWTQRYVDSVATSTNHLVGTGASAKYVVDYVPSGTELSGEDLIDDIELELSWDLGTSTLLELWQPTWVNQPETTQNRTSDWDDLGTPGNKFIQGFMLEANTYGQAKTIGWQRSDDGQIFYPDQTPITLSTQRTIPLTFTPPFLAHNVRRVTDDNVPWAFFSEEPVFQPYPEPVSEYQTEFMSYGNIGWETIREMNLSYASTATLTVLLQFDQWPSITLTFPSTNGVQQKLKTNVPDNKFKLVSHRISSTSTFFLFKDQCEIKVGQWGRDSSFRNVNPYGGPAGTGAPL